VSTIIANENGNESTTSTMPQPQDPDHEACQLTVANTNTNSTPKNRPVSRPVSFVLKCSLKALLSPFHLFTKCQHDTLSGVMVRHICVNFAEGEQVMVIRKALRKIYAKLFDKL
jgi:hypothetical protein